LYTIQDLRILALFSLATLLVFIFPNSFNQIHTRGEGREALVAQNILVEDAWVLPHGYSDSVPSKPPLLHWAIATSSLVIDNFFFGRNDKSESGKNIVSEMSVRLPSALASLIFVLFFYLFLRRFEEREISLFSAIVLISSLEWLRYSTTARVDMLLATLSASSICSLFLMTKENKFSYRVCSILLLTGASLTKGPIGILLPVVIFSTYLLLENINQKGLKELHKDLISISLKALPLLLIPLLLTSIWYFAAYAQVGEAFYEKFYQENIARFLGELSDLDDPHQHSFLYLWIMFLVGLSPWSVIWLFGWGYEHRTFYRPSQSRLATIKSWWLRRSSFEQLSIVACIISLFFFSIPEGKRSVYLLPIYPFATYLITRSIFDFSAPALKFTTFTSWITILVFSFILFLSSAYLTFVDLKLLSGGSSANDFIKALQPYSFADNFLNPLLSLALVSAIAIIIIYYLIKRREQFAFSYSVRPLFVPALVWITSIYTCYFYAFAPNLSQSLSGKDFAQSLSRYLAPDDKLYSLDHEFYSINFYSRRDIDRFESERSPPQTFYILTYEKSIKDLASQLNAGAEIKLVLKSDDFVTRIGRYVGLYKVSQGNLIIN
jgi:4-amino-4-deoxy-L-arabinose transferase-like glycosyltransferase